MNLRIYVTYHRPGRIISNRVITPIHGGKACSQMDLGIPGDDRNDHISHLNPHYCELTTQYWVWKNCTELDYAGFMHYRRHFSCGNTNRQVSSVTACVNYRRWDQEYERIIGLTDPGILEEMVDGYDLVLPCPFPVQNWGGQTVVDQLGTIPQLNRWAQFNRHNVEHALGVVETLEPDYAPALREVFFERFGSYYFFNSYIMRWEFFDRYNRWLFPLLEAIHRSIDYSQLNANESRLLGFLSERLFNVYLRHYQANVRKLAIKHVPLTLIEEGVWSNLGQGRFFDAANLFARKLQIAYKETRTYGPVFVAKRVLHIPTGPIWSTGLPKRKSTSRRKLDDSSA